MLGNNARAFRSEPKMKCFTWRISTVQFLQRIIGNWTENRFSSSGMFSQDLFHWRPSTRSEKDPQDQNHEPEKFEGWVIFMSMFNDIDWTKGGNSEKILARHSREDSGHSQAQVMKRTGTEHTWRKMRFHRRRDGGKFQGNWTPLYSRASVLWVVEFWKESGRCTTHFNADSSNTELLFRTILSATKLSIYGAVSSWCEQFAQRTPNQIESIVEKFAAKENEGERNPILRESVKMRHSREESLLGWATKLFLT